MEIKQDLTDIEVFKLCLAYDLRIPPSYFSSYAIRKSAYRAWGYTEEAFDDGNMETRLEAYRAIGHLPMAGGKIGWFKAISDYSSDIRVNAYILTGFTDESKLDASPRVRLFAYRHLGWDLTALKDDQSNIRLQAYRILGFQKDKNGELIWKQAFNDTDTGIRKEAGLIFGFPEAAIKSDLNVKNREIATLQHWPVKDDSEYVCESISKLNADITTIKSKYSKTEAQSFINVIRLGKI